MNKQLLLLIVASCLAIATSPAQIASLFDPKIDDPGREWCYAAQSTTVIGLPFVPEPIQVTYDGAIYTRYAELAFFYGPSLTPVMARNKTFLEGWLPVVEYGWSAGGVEYSLEIFSGELPELGRTNLVQFASLSMRNSGNAPAEGVVGAAARGSAATFRLGEVHEPCTPTTTFALDNNSLTKNGKLIYQFSAGAALFATPGVAYTGPYRTADFHINDSSATGLSVYRRMLQPGEEFSVVFKMPRIPVDNPKLRAAIASADYQSMRGGVIESWKMLFGDFEFQIPEKRVNDTYRAALVHLLLATRDTGDGKRQGSGLPYDDLFLNDYMDMMLAYTTAGLSEFAEPNTDWLMRKQHESGMFIDVHNRGRADFVTSHGQGLFALAYPLVVSEDMAYGKKVYPAIRKGAEFIVNDHLHNNKYGLIRSSIPYDAPMLQGHYTCHNLFALVALRTSIRAARIMGETKDAEAWSEAEKTYRQAILRAIDDVYKKEGYVRSGLYDWKPGLVQDNPAHGVNEFPNQDWENNLLVYPTELLQPNDPRVAKTLATIRARKYREGVMTYRNGMHVHQYATINQANQYRAIGDQKHALLDLYHVLLHNGSTHEGFENLVIPWSNRTPEAGCPPPHAWAAAKTALFIRNAMVCEYGGEAGLNEKERDLYLFSLLSPSWIVPGQKVAMRNAPTEMGPVSAALEFKKDGGELTMQTKFHKAPRYLAVRIPYSVELKSFKSDAKRSFVKNGVLYLSPDVKKATLKWREKPGVNKNNYQDILKSYRSEYDFVVKDGNYDPSRAGKPFLLDDEKTHPAEPLSFDLVRRTFLKEYTRRFEEYTKHGGTPYPVEPPPLR